MPFDPVAYGQMLDEALASRPTMGFRSPNRGAAPMGGTIDGAPMDGQSLQQAPQPGGMPARGQQPLPGAEPPQDAPQAGGKIPTKPPFEIKYKKGGLKGVKTFGDVMDAMTPSSQRQYMDWWEQQHGAINERWNMLQQELGQRPDPNADMSRKEQFRMLMEFGIELMRRANDPNGPGEAFAQAYGGARGRKAQEAQDYDRKRAMIEQGRASELDSIGTYGEALRGQAQIDENAVQMQEAQARMRAAQNKAPETIGSDQGIHAWDADEDAFKPVTGIDGKPLTNLKVGSRGGIGRDTRTANQKNIDDLIDRGVPEQLALDIVYRRITDPRKAFEKLYDSARRRFASEAEAKAEAEDIISGLYGEDWHKNVSRPSINRDDPLGLRD